MQKLTEQHRKKISIAMKGRNLSEGHKAKLRVAMKGINTWAKDRTVSNETKEKLLVVK